MKTRTTTIRSELVWALLKSTGAAVLCMLFLCVIMIIASLSRSFAVYFNKHIFEFIILFLFVFSIIIIVFFLQLVKSRINYLEEITKTLDRISEGNLDIHIPVKTTDELGKMANTVNVMALKLKTAIDEERASEKTKNDLITNISHDLRTPLTSALGYLELMSKIEYSDEAELRRYSHIAYDQCKGLKVLIDDLFEFSKLKNPGILIDKRKINIGELLEQVILGFIPEFNEAEMEYRMFFSSEKLIVNIDPILLKRVFENLSNNAIKYGREGKYVDFELYEENREVVIKIINYGKPIPDTDLPYVFDRFYRADKSRSGRKSGSGLGLAIAKSIIELHDGSIGASSIGGRTIFEVRLKLDTVA